MSEAAEFRMPSLGADMDEGTLVEWLVAPGDPVTRGQIVAVVDTAKAAIEVEVFDDGVVDELFVAPGTTVEVGTPLARLRSGDRTVTADAGKVEPKPTTAEPAAVGSGPSEGRSTPEEATGDRRPRPAAHEGTISPIVRHLAHDRGLDLAAVQGSGPHGEITREDVVAAVPSPEDSGGTQPGAGSAPGSGSPAPGTGERVKASPLARRRAGELGVDLASVVATGPDGVVTVADVERGPRLPVEKAQSTPAPDRGSAPAARGDSTERAAKQRAMREAIGSLMARSKREIPHYYLRTTIDLATAMTWLRERNAERGVEGRVVPAALLLKAAALAASEVPEVNGFFTDGQFVPSAHVHLGVAVSLRGGGLVAPAIHDADRLDLDGIMSALKDLVSRARSGRLKGSQMSDPTLTVTNLGDQGVEEVQGVIYPPQVALVGFGRVVERPWAVDGLLGVHPLVVATLAADHRVTDGHRGGRYLAAVEAHLHQPQLLDPVE